MIDKKEIWENAHKENYKWLLTGSSPEKVYSFHDVKPTKNQDIMEIGIGLGGSIQYLSEHNNVTAVDISQSALDRVSGIADTFLTPDMIEIPDGSMDWGLCHLVIQHCNDDMTRFILTEASKKIKPDGFFSFQFAYLPDPNVSMEDKYNETISDDLLFFRGLEEMESIVNDCGINILSTKLIDREFVYGIRWYVMKIKGA